MIDFKPWANGSIWAISQWLCLRSAGDVAAKLIVKIASCHYNDVKMSAVASQTTSLTIVYPTVYSGTDQRKHQSSASLAFVRGIHRWPVSSPHKWPVTRKNVSIWWRHHVLLISHRHRIFYRQHSVYILVHVRWWMINQKKNNDKIYSRALNVF